MGRDKAVLSDTCTNKIVGLSPGHGRSPNRMTALRPGMYKWRQQCRFSGAGNADEYSQTPLGAQCTHGLALISSMPPREIKIASSDREIDFSLA
ncbi:hypothetical protein AA0488_0034 [Kozakia baliensis NRIC 0488]|nr:hypothetical protein AA0488_0034 [Kozakia baliensis NRIC 0488]